eukprot:1980838-Rhodomonas_salina.2
MGFAATPSRSICPCARDVIPSVDVAKCDQTLARGDGYIAPPAEQPFMKRGPVKATYLEGAEVELWVGVSANHRSWIHSRDPDPVMQERDVSWLMRFLFLLFFLLPDSFHALSLSPSLPLSLLSRGFFEFRICEEGIDVNTPRYAARSACGPRDARDWILKGYCATSTHARSAIPGIDTAYGGAPSQAAGQACLVGASVFLCPCYAIPGPDLADRGSRKNTFWNASTRRRGLSATALISGRPT